MIKTRKEEIENYINNWSWSKNRKRYAFEIGKLIFSFMDYLADNNLSERTIKKHLDNASLIGMFEVGYGYEETFSPKNLEGGPDFIYEFKRKVSDSKYALQSYESTWRKIDEFIKSNEYKKYRNKIEKEIENK